MNSSKPNLNYYEIDGLLYPDLQISNQAEADQQTLGKYGRMALNFLRNHHPQRFLILKMQGNLMEKMLQVEQEAHAKMEVLTKQLLRLHPMPQTEDILERTRHLNQIKSTAEELVLNDIILKPR
ncbi:Transposon-encoded protein TnpV [Paenibacillus sophorae]|uniref:TnpV protein n=1 Tax=Paenibacillus sophorae TaxID=1333845 RepID=A0A1H8UBS7_9BACL|nr:TnpV protein [Paenibacillus sophorae]QWU13197.1 TnpV protein [Paenibacillus sophorae]SEP00712.1 Transposon-encoded protein TnpV [Paenibacillus sophorae]